MSSYEDIAKLINKLWGVNYHKALGLVKKYKLSKQDVLKAYNEGKTPWELAHGGGNLWTSQSLFREKKKSAAKKRSR